MNITFNSVAICMCSVTGAIIRLLTSDATHCRKQTIVTLTATSLSLLIQMKQISHSDDIPNTAEAF